MRKSHLRMPFGVTSSCLVALALASGPAIAQAPGDVEIAVRELPDQPAEPQAVPGEIIVKMRPGMTAEQVLPATDLVALGVRSAPRVTSGGELVYQLTPEAMFALRSEEAAMARMADLAAQLSARPEVEYAQPNWILRPSLTPNDPLYPLQWHYRNNGSGSDQSPGGINLPNAWDTPRGRCFGRGGGAGYRHPARAGRHRGLAQPRSRLRHDHRCLHRQRRRWARQRSDRSGRCRGRRRMRPQSATDQSERQLARQSRRRNDRGRQHQQQRRGRGRELVRDHGAGARARQVRRHQRRHQRRHPLGGGTTGARRPEQPRTRRGSST